MCGACVGVGESLVYTFCELTEHIVLACGGGYCIREVSAVRMYEYISQSFSCDIVRCTNRMRLLLWYLYNVPSGYYVLTTMCQEASRVSLLYVYLCTLHTCV